MDVRTTSTTKKIIEGCTVQVKARMWPGINKPGGVARVTKCNADGTFDVAYVLGGRGKNVEAEYLELHTTLTTTNSLKRAAAPKRGEFAVPQSKRRKSNGGDASESSEKETSDDGGTGSKDDLCRNGSSSTNSSSSSSSSTDETGNQSEPSGSEDENGLYKKGDIVVVQARLWPGINKPGGVGRVIKYNFNGKQSTVNVRYILGGVDKDIDLEYVKPEEQHENGETRSTSKKNREKRRKRGAADHASEDDGTGDDSNSIPSSPSANGEARPSSNSQKNIATSTTTTSSSSSKHSKITTATPASSTVELKATPDDVKRSPVSRMGYVTYRPDLERFEIVRKSITKMYRAQNVKAASIEKILQVCQLALNKVNEARQQSDSSTTIDNCFDEGEIREHLNAIEPEGNIFVVRHTGMVYYTPS